MTNKEFDKIFRDKLSGHKTPVDGGMWRSIEAGLGGVNAAADGANAASDGNNIAPVGWWSSWRKRAGYAVAAVAAVAVILVTVLITIENKTHLPIKTIDAGLPKLVAQSASAEPAEAKAPVLQPEKSESAAAGKPIVQASKQGGNPAIVEHSADAVMAVPGVNAAQNQDTVAAEQSVNTVAAEAIEVTEMATLPLMADEYGGTLEKKMRSYSLFSNIAPRNDITASSSHLGVMASSGISHLSSELQSMEIISQAKHSLPLNLGVRVQFDLGEKISAGVGLSYTLLRSRYEALINKKFHNVKQSLHYIGVPVNFYFTIMQNNSLKFYANVGGAVEKGLRASYHLKSYDGTSISAKADIDGFQYSANFGLGLEYRFSDLCGIYLEPNAVYFFDSKVPASVRTDQPFQLKAELGFRFHL